MGKKIIDTCFDTLAVNFNGMEYIIIPMYKENKIFLYKLPTGDARGVADLFGLPEDAEFVNAYYIDNEEDTKIFEYFGITDPTEIVRYRMNDIVDDLEEYIRYSGN